VKKEISPAVAIVLIVIVLVVVAGVFFTRSQGTTFTKGSVRGGLGRN